jgi:predicted kinase
MIVIVSGLPATGKTYFSESLAEFIQAKFINTDSEREKLDLPQDNTVEINQKVYEQVLKEMAAQIQYKKKVVVEGIFHKEKTRSMFMKKARELHQKVFFIEIKAGDYTVHERLKKRPDYTDADYKVYLQSKSEYEPVYYPHLVLWSDDQDVDEMVEKANVYIFGQET